MKKKKFYTVMAIKESAEVTLGIASLGLAQKQDIQFSGIADGCVGVLLVFSNKKKAQKYAGSYPVAAMEEQEMGDDE